MGLDHPLHFNHLVEAEDLLAHDFFSGRPTKILSHGWNSDGRDFSDNFVEGEAGGRRGRRDA